MIVKKKSVGRPKVKNKRVPCTFMADSIVYNIAVKGWGKSRVNKELEQKLEYLAEQIGE